MDEAKKFHLTWSEEKQEWQIHSKSLAMIPIFKMKKEAWQATKTYARKARGQAIAYHKRGSVQEICNYSGVKGPPEPLEPYKREHELDLRNKSGEPARTIDHRVWCKTHNCWRIECPSSRNENDQLES